MTTENPQIPPAIQSGIGTLIKLGHCFPQLPLEFARVELKGYYTHIGRIYEKTRFGFTYGCVDTLVRGEIVPVLFPPTSVFRITMLTEAEVDAYYTSRTSPPERPRCNDRCLNDDEYDDSDPFADEGPDYTTYFESSSFHPDSNTLVATFIYEDGKMNFAGNGYIAFEDERVEDEAGETGWNCTHWRNIDPKAQAVFDRNDDSRR